MSSNTRTRSIIFVIVLAAIIQTVLVTSRNKQTASQPTSDLILRAAKNLQARGIMSVEDDLALHRIIASVKNSHKISDSDFNWTLNEMYIKSGDPSIVHAKIMAVYLLPCQFTDKQKGVIYQQSVSLITNKSAHDLDKQYACRVFGAIKDNRAVPYILPLADNSSPYLSKAARKALSAMGYKLKKDAS